MEPHFTEHEDVEKVKRWWREYGRSIVVGVVIGLLIMAGVRAWMAHKEESAQVASALYGQLSQAAASEDEDAVQELAARLQDEYGGTPYADLAAFVQARLKVEAGAPAEAVEPLERVARQGATEELRQVARLRLARAQLAADRPDAALSTLAEGEPGSFASHYEAVRGDIYAAQERQQEARAAYERALAGMPSDDPMRQLLQMKRDDLRVAQSPPEEGTR